MLKINQEVFSTLLLGVLLFLTLSIVISILILRFIKNKQKHSIQLENMKAEFEKQLLQSQMEVQESTFSSLGQELHDNVGQLLSTTKMLLGITERNMEQIPDTLNTANATLGKAIHELRALSKSLTKEWLEQFDFNENLKNEVARIDSSGVIKVHLSSATELPLRRDEQIILFRIVQEALQNTIKHAHAENLSIIISNVEDELRIIIEDDGVGFVEKEQPAGIGLMNMKHRMRILGGHINWISSQPKGIQVLIRLKFQSISR